MMLKAVGSFLWHPMALGDLTGLDACFVYSLCLTRRHLYMFAPMCLPSLVLCSSPPSPLHTLSRAGLCLGKLFPLHLSNRQNPAQLWGPAPTPPALQGSPSTSDAGWRKLLRHPQLTHTTESMSYALFKFVYGNPHLTNDEVLRFSFSGSQFVPSDEVWVNKFTAQLPPGLTS